MKKAIISGAALAWLALAATAPNGFAASGQISKVDFTPGKEIGLLVLNYTGKGAFRVFQSEQKGSVIVEAENLSLPASLTRAIDASSKEGPVMQITPYNSGDGRKQISKFVVQLRQKAEATSSDLPGRFVLEIRKKNVLGLTKDAAAESRDELKLRSAANDKGDEVAKKLVEVLNTAPAEKVYFGSRVTFEANNADVHDVFRLVGESSGLNIITDTEVNAKSNYSLKDIPWDQLLDIVIQQASLKAIISGNVIRIIPMEKFNKDQEAKLKQIAIGDELEPVIMAVIPLSFAKAEEMSTMINALIEKKENPGNDPNKLAEAGAAKQPVKAADTAKSADAATSEGAIPKVSQDFKRGQIQVDGRSNSLVVTNTKDAIERIRRLVKELDVPIPQVLIDAKVVIANDGFRKRVGVKWGGKLTSMGTGRAGIGAGFNGSETLLGAAEATDGNPPFTIAGPSSGLMAGFQLGAGRHGNLQAALELAESNEVSKTVASPRVIVNNKVKARISDGQKLYVPTSAGANGSGTIVPVEAALDMSVTPQVTSSGSILLGVDIKKDAITSVSETQSVDTSQKQITTEVLVDNGSTLVLGGVYQFQANKAEGGIPLLKDLPFVGQLFRTNTDSNAKQELMVFITPQIITPTGFAAETATQ